jgi:hypothetical protein
MGLLDMIKRKTDIVMTGLINAVRPLRNSPEEEFSLIQISQYPPELTPEFYKLETWFSFMVDPCFKDDDPRKITLLNLKKKYYLIPISEKGRGRDDFFKALGAKLAEEALKEGMGGPPAMTK